MSDNEDAIAEQEIRRHLSARSSWKINMIVQIETPKKRCSRKNATKAATDAVQR